MTHSHDRTLLSRLGFADPDKKDPLHTLACQYISQPDVCASLKLVAEDGRPLFCDGMQPALEVPISKGENQYKTTIGFLDAVLPMYYLAIDSAGGR